MASAWNTNFFAREKTNKTSTPSSVKWETYDQENQTEAYKWEYFDIPGGELGTREIRSNKNLLNPNEFAKYWQTGKHKDYHIYQAPDLDGDGSNDLVAINPQGYVVGFNDRYVTKEGVGETPYKKAYYSLPKDKRKELSYQQFLMNQDNKPGWKNLDKFKESKNKSPIMVVKQYLATELAQYQTTEKQSELICKKLVDMISTTFFDTNVPAYQIKTIKGTPEFKKILKDNITSESIVGYIPQGIKKMTVERLLNIIKGYDDGGFINWLKQQYDTQIKDHRLAVQATNDLYIRILSKSAAAKIFKDYNITPMYLVDHPEEVNGFKQAVEAAMAEMDKKHKMKAVGTDIEFK